MLVLVRDDNLTQDHIQALHVLYPEDPIRYLKEDLFTDHLSEFVVHKLHPKRISLVGQASADFFGDPDHEGFSPVELANFLVDKCQLPRSVEIIDLLAVTPQFLQKGDSFVRAFTKQLAIRGYDEIEVKALTNFKLDLLATNVTVETSKKYQIRGLSNNSENSRQETALNQKLNELNTHIEKIKHELHRELSVLTLDMSKDKQQQSRRQLITQLRNRLHQCVRERDALIKKRHSSFDQVPISTHDVRKSLDKDPQFYFHGKIILQIDTVTNALDIASQNRSNQHETEISVLEKNLSFLFKKSDFMVTLNAHLAELESSIRGFKLFSNLPAKLARIKEIQELKSALIETTDLNSAIDLITERLKDEKLSKGIKNVTKDTLQNMLTELRQLDSYERPLPDQTLSAG